MTTQPNPQDWWHYYLNKAVATRRSVSVILKESVASYTEAKVKPPHLTLVVPIGAMEYLLQQEKYGLIQLFDEDKIIVTTVLKSRRWTKSSDRLITFFPLPKLNPQEFLRHLEPSLEEVAYAFHSFQDR